MPRQIAVSGFVESEKRRTRAFTLDGRAIVGTGAAIVRLIAADPGTRIQTIAERLGIAASTVKKHLYRAYRSLGIRTHAELIARLGSAARVGVTAPPAPRIPGRE